MKESRIWMFWKVFYCQMECKNQWLWGNFVRFEMPWPGALQLFDKTEISSQSFLPHFFPFFAILHCMLGHLVPLWEGDGVSSHEVRWIRKAASNKVCSPSCLCQGRAGGAVPPSRMSVCHLLLCAINHWWQKLSKGHKHVPVKLLWTKRSLGWEWLSCLEPCTKKHTKYTGDLSPRKSHGV